MDDRAHFLERLAQFDSIAQVERITGRSRRSIELKRDGKRRVDYWDVLALERALPLVTTSSETLDLLDESRFA